MTATRRSPHITPVPARSRRSVTRDLDPASLEISYHTVHGYRRAYLKAGRGPALLLIHGIGDSSESWRALIPRLAESHTVVVPDLLGHGRSDKPRADYSIAAYANGMRDLLSVLGIERATIVGHSLGGGVAAQFAYQFPDRCERLVLVGSGGVGREVSPAPAPGRLAARRRRPAGAEPARRRRGCRAHHRAAAAHPPSARSRLGRGPSRARRPPRRLGPAGVRPHPAVGGRLARPARDHARPLLPRRGHADAPDLGLRGRHHPRVARPPRPRRHARQPARGLRGRRPLPPPRRPRALRGRRSSSSSTRPSPPTTATASGATCSGAVARAATSGSTPRRRRWASTSPTAPAPDDARRLRRDERYGLAGQPPARYNPHMTTGAPHDRRGPSTALLTDHYELSALDAVLAAGIDDHRAVFELFGRGLPPGRRYGVVAGQARAMDAVARFRFGDAELEFLQARGFLDPATLAWLADYRFSGTIDGYRDGELYFPGSPLLTVEGPFAEAPDPRDGPAERAQPRRGRRLGRRPDGRRRRRANPDRGRGSTHPRGGRGGRGPRRRRRRRRRHVEPRGRTPPRPADRRHHHARVHPRLPGRAGGVRRPGGRVHRPDHLPGRHLRRRAGHPQRGRRRGHRDRRHPHRLGRPRPGGRPGPAPPRRARRHRLRDRRVRRPRRAPHRRPRRRADRPLPARHPPRHRVGRPDGRAGLQARGHRRRARRSPGAGREDVAGQGEPRRTQGRGTRAGHVGPRRRRAGVAASARTSPTSPTDGPCARCRSRSGETADPSRRPTSRRREPTIGRPRTSCGRSTVSCSPVRPPSTARPRRPPRVPDAGRRS